MKYHPVSAEVFILKPTGKSRPKSRGKSFTLHVCCWIPNSFKRSFSSSLEPGSSPPTSSCTFCLKFNAWPATLVTAQSLKQVTPSSLLLLQPNKETEGAETKYAGEGTTQTQPPALHLTILCVKYGNAIIHTQDIICFDKLMTVKLRPDTADPLPPRTRCQRPLHPAGLKRATEPWDTSAR